MSTQLSGSKGTKCEKVCVLQYDNRVYISSEQNAFLTGNCTAPTATEGLICTSHQQREKIHRSICAFQYRGKIHRDSWWKVKHNAIARIRTHLHKIELRHLNSVRPIAVMGVRTATVEPDRYSEHDRPSHGQEHCRKHEEAPNPDEGGTCYKMRKSTGRSYMGWMSLNSVCHKNLVSPQNHSTWWTRVHGGEAGQELTRV